MITDTSTTTLQNILGGAANSTTTVSPLKVYTATAAVAGGGSPFLTRAALLLDKALLSLESLSGKSASLSVSNLTKTHGDVVGQVAPLDSANGPGGVCFSLKDVKGKCPDTFDIFVSLQGASTAATPGAKGSSVSFIQRNGQPKSMRTFHLRPIKWTMKQGANISVSAWNESVINKNWTALRQFAEPKRINFSSGAKDILIPLGVNNINALPFFEFRGFFEAESVQFLFLN